MSLFHSKPSAAQELMGPEYHKKHAAKTSVVAATGLVAFKIIVGTATGSLGIIAEAAHSGLDLVAAIVTYCAVRMSAKPADHDHPYGHGKVENLSAFFETFLLLITCFWIIHAAVQRLLTGNIEIEVNVWSYLVMFVSIAVDVSRSRMLYRVAREHKSQALEADALHFSTDIWSSGVVILGLICVSLSSVLRNAEFLHYADAVAAIVVALIVIQVSIRLGLQTISALLDTAPAGIDARIVSAVEKVPGVVNCHHVRIRMSGPQMFIDLHVLLDGNMPLKEAHRLTEIIESVIQEIVPNADITVHPEPL